MREAGKPFMNKELTRKLIFQMLSRTDLFTVELNKRRRNKHILANPLSENEEEL